jgi:hypothetical protein
MHRGLHRTRVAVPIRRKFGRYSALMTVKERLHRVVEEMTDEEAKAMLRRIEALRSDPFLRFLDEAPIDDEPVTAEEEVALAEVEADRAAGLPTIPFEDVKGKYA